MINQFTKPGELDAQMEELARHDWRGYDAV